MANSRTRQGNKWLEAITVEQNKIPEQKLWNSVLLVAACDALRFKSFDMYANNDSQMAKNWFINDGLDFKRVCELAGYNPKYVRNKMLKKIKEKDEKNNLSEMYGKRIYHGEKTSRI